MRIAIIGASGGIGQALLMKLLGLNSVEMVYATYYRHRPKIRAIDVVWEQMDLTKESSVADWSRNVGELDWLINAAGILHNAEHRPEKSIAEVNPEFFMHNISINSLATLMLARYLQCKFDHGRPAIFSVISARVGSIEDNRLGGWYSYRASKAALNMGVKTLSLEWKRTLPNISVVALHPGTTDTSLSAPFQRNVPKDRLFSADHTAGCLIRVLRELSPKDTGKFLSYSGEVLPW